MKMNMRITKSTKNMTTSAPTTVNGYFEFYPLKYNNLPYILSGWGTSLSGAKHYGTKIQKTFLG